MFALRETPVAPHEGLCPETEGGVVSGSAAMVKEQVSCTMAFPARSEAFTVTSTTCSHPKSAAGS